ncbi:S-layer homology domain-containing protein [Paenibacillus dokdonensis]|uniref:S-layer homology domain-containing protein n=1 Tax=Paenibacillus dokdonensis TaxID=2567944 RepID=UPI0010A77349|nr:S-layer homology domain-containing protein [Paenibacillus dokdonensis]
MLRKSLIIALFCTFCSSTWLASAHAETASDFQMKASSKESSDSTFTITLKGSNIKDLYAYEVKFKIDPSELEVVKAETKIKGYSVSPIVKNNEVTIAHTKIGNVDGDKGDMDIATITFKAKKAGSSKVEWISMKMLDKNLKDQVITPGQSTTFMKIFKDIASHWAKDDIMQMVDQKIVEGMDSDRFAPNNNVTRAQFAALITRALDLKDGDGKNPFTDVKSGAWYEETVKKAYSAGIVSGMTSNTFAPDQSISREEMTVMLMRAKAAAQGVKADDLPGGTSSSFKDSGKISSWAQKSVGFAISTGLMKGRTETTFAPKEHATRAESAVVIKRLLASGK